MGNNVQKDGVTHKDTKNVIPDKEINTKFKHILNIEPECKINTNQIMCVGKKLYVTTDSRENERTKMIYRIDLDKNLGNNFCLLVTEIWYFEHFVKNINDEMFVCFGSKPTYISKLNGSNFALPKSKASKSSETDCYSMTELEYFVRHDDTGDSWEDDRKSISNSWWKNANMHLSDSRLVDEYKSMVMVGEYVFSNHYRKDCPMTIFKHSITNDQSFISIDDPRPEGLLRREIELKQPEKCVQLLNFNDGLIMATSDRIIMYDVNTLEETFSLKHCRSIINACVNTKYMYLMHSKEHELYVDVIDLCDIQKCSSIDNCLINSILVGKITKNDMPCSMTSSDHYLAITHDSTVKVYRLT